MANEEKKRCPKCDTECDVGDLYCTNCSCKFDFGGKSDLSYEYKKKVDEYTTNIESSTPNTEDKQDPEYDYSLPEEKPDYSFVVILLIVIGVIAGMIALLLNTSSNTEETQNNTSLIQFEQKIVEDLTADSILNTLIIQDKKLRNYIQQKNKETSNFDKLFEIFYRNLLTFTGRETELASKLTFDSYEHNGKSFFTESNIGIKKIENEEYSYYTIVQPKTKLVKLVNSGEGFWSAEINYNYLVTEYSSYLSKDWQEFLEIKQKEFNYKNGNSYYRDGAITVTKNELADWLITETNFLNKYPQFALKDIMKADLKNYTSDFIEDIYQTFAYDPPQLLNETKLAYEKFLIKADKNTEEYIQVKKWYEILQKDNFTKSLNYYRYKYDLTGDENYKLEYERMKAEINSKNKFYDLNTPSKVLAKIDELQTKYFSLVKRNDVLLQIEDNEVRRQDLQDLNILFNEVEQNIDKNNFYFQKYKQIEEQFTVNPGITTLDMIEFDTKHYNAIDKLLNEVYREVKTRIEEKDFAALTNSELKWLKEVEQYKNVYESKQFGSIRYLIYLGYEINMREFRTLLLMLYL